MWTVNYTKEAFKQLSALSSKDRESVIQKIENLATFEKPASHPQDKFLSGPLRKYLRLRVAGIRVLFQAKYSEKTLIIVTVLHRKNVYRQ